MTHQARHLLAFLTLALAAAFADDDPPSRVARLNYQSGSVSFRPAAVEDWTAATVNYPLTTGDHLWGDSRSQTELHVGSTAIRMGSHTALAILNLDDRSVQLSLTEGSLNVRVRELAEDESYEVDTPNVAVTLLRPGDYRIDVDGERNITIVTVRSGDAAVTGGGLAFPVHPRQSARLTGIDQVIQEMSAALPPDEFDQWCDSRDRREDEAQISARYVPRDMVGYEDLDANGAWNESPQYGWVWEPRTVPVGWAPYRYGHWAWVEPWGWTWIDDASWGFAPFHYGRWAYTGVAWVWVPGRMTIGVRPVYAPALVAFIGGPRFGVSVGVGGVAAWFPLGPGEPFRPAYRVSDRYARQVNVTHVTNINVTNTRYANQNVNGAVTAVSNDTFISRRPVSQAALRVDARDVSQAQVVGMTAPIAPRRESIGGRTGAPVATPSARYTQRTVVVKTQPPPAPVPFSARQEALRENQGRPLEPSQVNRLRSNGPVERQDVRTVPPSMGGNSPRQRMETRQPVVTAPSQPAPTQPEPRRVEQPRNERPQIFTPRPQTPPEPRRVEQPRNERPVFVPPPAQPDPPQRRVERERPPERPAVVAPPAPATQRNADQPRESPRSERPQRDAAPKSEKASPRGERKQDEKK